MGRLIPEGYMTKFGAVIACLGGLGKMLTATSGLLAACASGVDPCTMPEDFYIGLSLVSGALVAFGIRRKLDNPSTVPVVDVPAVNLGNEGEAPKPATEIAGTPPSP